MIQWRFSGILIFKPFWKVYHLSCIFFISFTKFFFKLFAQYVFGWNLHLLSQSLVLSSMMKTHLKLICLLSSFFFMVKIIINYLLITKYLRVLFWTFLMLFWLFPCWLLFFHTSVVLKLIILSVFFNSHLIPFIYLLHT